MADFINLQSLLDTIDFSTIGKESNSFEDLPAGYYLCEVEKAELKDNKAGTNRQVSFQFKVIEDGVHDDINDSGYSEYVTNKGTKNRKIFKHYPFKDAAGVKRFLTDTQKFTGEDGQPILELEYFTTEETFEDALAILEGKRIYINANYKEYQGKTSIWYDLISWDRASKLELPM